MRYRAPEIGTRYRRPDKSHLGDRCSPPSFSDVPFLYIMSRRAWMHTNHAAPPTQCGVISKKQLSLPDQMFFWSVKEEEGNASGTVSPAGIGTLCNMYHRLHCMWCMCEATSVTDQLRYQTSSLARAPATEPATHCKHLPPSQQTCFILAIAHFSFYARSPSTSIFSSNL